MTLSQILPFASNFVVILFFVSSWMSISTASPKNKMPRNFLQKLICKSVVMRFLLVFLLLSTTGCKWFIEAKSPVFKWLSAKIPDGTPVFQEGFKDGCGTSSYTRGNIFYKTINKHNYNTKLIGNAEYRFGYARGYTWCFQNALGGVGGPQASFDRYISPYGNDAVITTSVGNINSLWGGFFESGIMQGDLTNSDVNFNSIVNIWQNAERGGGTVLGGNPLWAGGSSGQFFGQ